MPKPSDPLGVDPLAIVRSAVDVDTLLRDAKLFSRNSIDSALNSGRLYAEAKEACPHGQWLPKLSKQGVSDRTVRYLIALWKKSQVKSATIADLTGTSDGELPAAPTTSPTTYATPIYCRPCRIGTPKEGCKGCKALRKNQPKLFDPPPPDVPKPPDPTGDAADEPLAETVLRDAEGLVLPERVRPYLEDDAIESWVKSHGRPAFDAMKELSGRPGASHVDVPLLAKKLSAVSRMVKSAKLTHRCPECSGEGCEKCANTGLLSRALWSER